MPARAIGGANGPKNPTVRPGGGGNIRPMYGVFMRDQMKSFRDDISTTINKTKTAIARGKPNAKEVAGDGILQGKELTKAKAAVKDLEKAMKALKPVFGGQVARPSDNGMGNIAPMYGIVFRDDLSRFRDGIKDSMRDMNAAIAAGQFKGEALKEAKLAVKHLKAALTDLGTAQNSWPR